MKPQHKSQPSGTPQAKTPIQRSAPDDGRSLALAKRAVEAALEKKALEPVLLDVREMASYTDYILVVSGRSDRQVAAIAESIGLALKKEHSHVIGKEGSSHAQWTLLDFGDVIVHVFYHPMRDFYDLESLWNDAPRIPLDIPPEARAGAEAIYESRD